MQKPMKIKLNLPEGHIRWDETRPVFLPVRRFRLLLSIGGGIAFGLALVAGIITAQDRKDSKPQRWELLFRQGHLEEAKIELQNALKQSPNSIDLLVSLGRVLLVEDNFDEASDQVRRALRLAPTNPDALTLYGHCLFREGNFKLAETQYRKSLRLDPRQAGAHLGLGRLYLTKLQRTQSIEAFQMAIDLAPNEEDHYFFASEAYGAAKNYSKQVECLEKYLSLKPKFNEERVQNARALLTFFRSLENQAVARIAEPARPYVIPFQPFYGLMLAEVQVNGQGPYRFLVDSGATATVLSNALLDELKIPTLSNAVTSCVGGTGKTATRLAKVDRFKTGDLELINLPVSSFDNAIFAELIDGVLSTADLADFLITLDYPDQKILLKPRSAAGSPKPSVQAESSGVEVPFRILGNLILLPVSINKQSAQNFLFDTGAVTSALSKRQAAFLGVRDDTPKAKVDLQFAGACGVTQSVLSVDQVDLSLQTMMTPYAKILAVELKEISKELRTEVSGILGGDFYSKRKVTIDYHNTRLIIE
jgi:tetratricopeptide (TPR) repeat protein